MTRKALENLIGCALMLGVLCPTTGFAQPPNDNCLSATGIVAALPFVDAPDTTAATLEAADIPHSCNGGAVDGNTVWYSYNAATDITLDIDTTGSPYGAVIAVYDGVCGPLLVERHCYLDPGGADTRLPVKLNAGDNVLIQISDPGLAGGILSIEVREAPYDIIEPVSTLELANSATISTFGTGLGYIARPTVLKPRKVAFGANDTGLFQNVAGVIGKIVSSGDPTPAGGTFQNFGVPAILNANFGVFWATIQGSPTLTQGIFMFNGGVITTVAVNGDPAPTGGVFTRFGSVSMNLGGDILFAATMDTAPLSAVFELPFGGGGLVARALEGDPNPCGGTIRSFGAVDVNIWGDFAFYVTAIGGDEGLLTDIAGVVSAVACENGAEPTFGGTYESIDGFQMSDVPEVVFRAEVDTGLTDIDAIYAGPPAAVAAIAGTGQVVGAVVLDRIDRRVTPAINNAGDVAFSSDLVAPDRQAIVVVPAGAAPGIAVRDGDPCGGGTFSRFGDWVSINGGSTISFDASCSVGRGVMQVSLGGVLSLDGLHTSGTGIGAGFSFEDSVIDIASNTVFRGNRSAVYGVGCSTAGVCTPPTVLAAPGDPWPAGRTVRYINTETVSGVRRPVFSLVTVGGGVFEAIGMVRGGGVRKVVESTDPLPGAAGGTFGIFAESDPFDPNGSIWRPAGHGGRVAFSATVNNHPTFTRGVFIFRGGTIAAIAGDGEPSPDGGTYVDFSSPAIAGSKVAFAAETTVGACVMYARRPTLVIPIACVGDPGPIVGTTIDEILAPPAFSGKNVVYAARLSGGVGVSECLIRSNGTAAGASAILCDGDVVPNGGTYATFASPSTDRVALETDKKGLAFSGVDLNDDLGLHAFYQGSLAEVAADGDPAPVAGTYDLDEYFLAITKYSVAFSTGLDGGTGTYGLFLSNLR